MGRQAGANRWRLRSKSKATPISKTFATKKEAEDYQKLVSRQLHESGTRHSEIVLTGNTQRHLQSALETGIPPEDLKDAAELWLASTRSAEGKNLTLGEAVEQALDCDHFKHRAETTRNGYKSKWLRFVRVMTPDKKLSSIGSQTIKDYLKDLTKDVSVNEAYSAHSDLRALYQTYFRKHLGIMETTPFHNEMIPAPSGRQVNSKEAYKEQELKDIFMAALREAVEIQQSPKRSDKELSFLPMLLIQALTGMRPGEAGQLTYGMFGEEGIIYNIDRASEEEEGDENLIMLPSKITKEKRARQVVMFDELKDSLFWWPYFLQHFEIFAEGFKVKPEYISKPVLEYNYVDFSRRLKLWCKSAGVPYKQNSLRHTFISHAIRGKFAGNTDELQFMVGHAKDTETTIKHYVKLTKKREAFAYFMDYSSLYAHKKILDDHIRKVSSEGLLIRKRSPKKDPLPNVVEVDFKVESSLRNYTKKRARIDRRLE